MTLDTIVKVRAFFDALAMPRWLVSRWVVTSQYDERCVSIALHVCFPHERDGRVPDVWVHHRRDVDLARVRAPTEAYRIARDMWARLLMHELDEQLCFNGHRVYDPHSDNFAPPWDVAPIAINIKGKVTV